MTYPKTLSYLYSHLPMYQRVGAVAYKANMDNTIKLCNLLDNPQDRFKTIHIAGTNGKGSTSHSLAAILQSAGYKTGLYTSPHLKDFRERIRINGKKISKKFVVEFVEKGIREWGLGHSEMRTNSLSKNPKSKILKPFTPSFFEMTVGLAFDYFQENKVDIAVIETGLGGRLDSTNIINPVLCVITNISLDHTHLLGDTIEKIAFEKAGIIKTNVPVVIGESNKKTDVIFISKAKEMQAPLFFADRNWKVKKWGNGEVGISAQSLHSFPFSPVPFSFDLRGFYQKKNILTVFQSCDILVRQGFKISEKQLRKGLENVKKVTGLMGRWQEISKAPLTICDVAHNIAGINEVVKQIALTPHEQLHMVIGFVNDKDIEGILKLLPGNAQYYFCKAAIERAMEANQLAQRAIHHGLQGSVFSTVSEAFAAAKIKAKTNDLIFIGGSTFVVAEVI